MKTKILARATAIVPENQPGGTYRENGYTVIPVFVQEVECEGGSSRMKRCISSLQEISVRGNLEVPKGSRLELEFDLCSLGGVNNWLKDREQGRLIRTTPYAVQVRYERKEI